MARLRAAGCVFAEDEAALLTAAASGATLEALVERRVAGEPLEHLLGWAAFDGLRVVVSPDVFVPRRRSELLVAIAGEGAPRRVLDLCCGTGAVGAALAARLPRVEVWASDVDPVAAACARHNLPPERVVEGDLYDALPSGLRHAFDVVVLNAPYVPTDALSSLPPEARDHEPRQALDGGPDGVDLHRRAAAGAREWLRPGGRLVVETSRAQSSLTVAACEAAGLAASVVRDGERDATAVVATAP